MYCFQFFGLMLLNLVDGSPHFAHSIRSLEAILMFYSISYFLSGDDFGHIIRCGKIEYTPVLTNLLGPCSLFFYIDVTKHDLCWAF